MEAARKELKAAFGETETESKAEKSETSEAGSAPATSSEMVQ
jgi:hypothetical protein